MFQIEYFIPIYNGILCSNGFSNYDNPAVFLKIILYYPIMVKMASYGSSDNYETLELKKTDTIPLFCRQFHNF